MHIYDFISFSLSLTHYITYLLPLFSLFYYNILFFGCITFYRNIAHSNSLFMHVKRNIGVVFVSSCPMPSSHSSNSLSAYYASTRNRLIWQVSRALPAMLLLLAVDWLNERCARISNIRAPKRPPFYKSQLAPCTPIILSTPFTLLVTPYNYYSRSRTPLKCTTSYQDMPYSDMTIALS